MLAVFELCLVQESKFIRKENLYFRGKQEKALTLAPSCYHHFLKSNHAISLTTMYVCSVTGFLYSALTQHILRSRTLCAAIPTLREMRFFRTLVISFAPFPPRRRPRRRMPCRPHHTRTHEMPAGGLTNGPGSDNAAAGDVLALESWL